MSALLENHDKTVPKNVVNDFVVSEDGTLFI